MLAILFRTLRSDYLARVQNMATQGAGNTRGNTAGNTGPKARTQGPREDEGLGCMTGPKEHPRRAVYMQDGPRS